MPPPLPVLVDIAGEGMPADMWRGLAAPGQSAVEIGRARARRKQGGFSYKNATIAEIGDEVAASPVGYCLADPYDLGDLDEVPEGVRPLLKLEAQAPGSWYINVLATFPEFRGQGIGTRLLEIAQSKARETRTPALSVVVGSWNEGAARLYARAGYSPVASEPAILPAGFPHQGDWVLMLRSLR
jgi:ribosomal protein S18 acetylase RimI-like enzyme